MKLEKYQKNINKCQSKLNVRNQEFNNSVLGPNVQDCFADQNKKNKHYSRCSTNNVDYQNFYK